MGVVNKTRQNLMEAAEGEELDINLFTPIHRGSRSRRQAGTPFSPSPSPPKGRSTPGRCSSRRSSCWTKENNAEPSAFKPARLVQPLRRPACRGCL
jgi:hypothetical protein